MPFLRMGTLQGLQALLATSTSSARATTAPMEKVSGAAGVPGPLSFGDAAIPENTRGTLIRHQSLHLNPRELLGSPQPQPAQATHPWCTELQMVKKASPKKRGRVLPAPSPFPSTSDAVVAVSSSTDETSTTK